MFLEPDDDDQSFLELFLQTFSFRPHGRESLKAFGWCLRPMCDHFAEAAEPLFEFDRTLKPCAWKIHYTAS